MANNSNNGSGLGALLTGVSIFAFSTYWPDLFGVTPGTYDFMFSGFGQFIGFVAGAHGFVQLSKTAQAKEQRKALEQTSGTFGTADFADAEVIEAKGLFDPHGLYLGLHNGQPIFHKGKAHLLTCAPARQGKGISTVIPNALHYPGSMVVTDPKGELAAVTGEHRQTRFGQKIAYFNPYRLHGLPQHRINGLEDILLSAGDPQGQRELMAKARRKAFQLYSEPEDGRNRVFRDGARDLLAFSPVFNALFEPESCTLPGIYRDIANPRRLRKKLAIAGDSDALGGALADNGAPWPGRARLDDRAGRSRTRAPVWAEHRPDDQVAVRSPAILRGEQCGACAISFERDGHEDCPHPQPQPRARGD